MNQFCVELDPAKHAELRELAEEGRMDVLLSKGLNILLTILKHQVRGYQPVFVPIGEDGEIDDRREMIFLQL